MTIILAPQGYPKCHCWKSIEFYWVLTISFGHNCQNQSMSNLICNSICTYNAFVDKTTDQEASIYSWGRMKLSNKYHYYFPQTLTPSASKIHQLFIKSNKGEHRFMKSGSNKYIAYDNFVAFKNSSTCENMQVINLN